MRERALQQFESIFERAAIPVLDIQHVPLRRLALVRTDAAADDSAGAVARQLQRRFDAELRVHVPAAAEGEDGEVFSSTAELVGQLRIGRADLVILAVDPDASPVVIDDLVLGVSVPVLILKGPLLDPDSLFGDILHSLHGNFQQTENFSYPFTLATATTQLLLLHTIDQDEIGDVQEALRYTGGIHEQGEAQLLDQLRHHGERYLRAVVAAARDEPFEPTYRLHVGPVVASVQGELESRRYSLLVIGKHREGLSEISAAEYQLMHIVRDVPVLAL